jgi:hypothetical protein
MARSRLGGLGRAELGNGFAGEREWISHAQD